MCWCQKHWVTAVPTVNNQQNCCITLQKSTFNSPKDVKVKIRSNILDSRSVTAAARCWWVSQQLLMSAKSGAGGSCLLETLHPTNSTPPAGRQDPENKLTICWGRLRKSTNRMFSAVFGKLYRDTTCRTSNILVHSKEFQNKTKKKIWM